MNQEETMLKHKERYSRTMRERTRNVPDTTSG